MPRYRKKLIEVSLPLEAIDAASAREKSIRHGHPSTLHLWWARRPLAACRAVLFAQLVDDPSAWPGEFPTEAEQKRERDRLHRLIADMVPWEASGDERVMGRARSEIARSLARGRGETPPARDDADAVAAFLAEHAPPVFDPFCGGGSIPLEAQRLGLRAVGADLNPVAVLVSKATCEIPPRFADRPPVNPDRDPGRAWRGAQGLACDIRYYGAWMRDRAAERIGHLYPKAAVTAAMASARPDLAPYAGKELTVIAWLWARTVASPDPMMRGVHVPLASSFVLSSKAGRRAVVVPVVEGTDYRFTVKADGVDAPAMAAARAGTKAARGANFTCLLSGAPTGAAYIKAEGMAGRMGARLMAVVAKGARGRVYLDPTPEMEAAARQAEPAWRPEGKVPERLTGGTCYAYGFTGWADLFTARQLTALTTFADLVSEAREQVKRDFPGPPASRRHAREARTSKDAGETPAVPGGVDAGETPAVPGRADAGEDAGAPRGGAPGEDETPLADGGAGAQAYADAVATYLGLCVSRQANRTSNLSFWHTGRETVEQVFARQALPMVWDFCEANPFSDSSGGFAGQVRYLANVVAAAPADAAPAAVFQRDAAGEARRAEGAVVATDPPYYDNIVYADLSDFFYVWQRRALHTVWPELFRRVLAPKDEEMVATRHRHDSKEEAERFFMAGMGRVLRNMHRAGHDDFPITLYYAFKQSEVAKEGLTSPGWATFLQGIFDAGYVIDGTWPVRTELAGNLKKRVNALASSIVLACRKRAADAPAATRREFVARLRAELPDALKHIRDGGVGPVDMAQAALGPGMGVFTGFSRVLEPDDTPMTVREAIASINRARDEISGEEATGYDPQTRFCIDWFEAFGDEAGASGDAITMAGAYDIGLADLAAAGVFATGGGEGRLVGRAALPPEWDPRKGGATHWACAQHLARALEAQDGGVEAAARLLAAMEPEHGEAARLLAYRLYDICERKGRSAEAQTWNTLAQEWPELEKAQARFEDEARNRKLAL